MSKVSFNNLPVGAKFRCKDRTFIKTTSEIYPTSVPLDRSSQNLIMEANMDIASRWIVWR